MKGSKLPRRFMHCTFWSLSLQSGVIQRYVTKQMSFLFACLPILDIMVYSVMMDTSLHGTHSQVIHKILLHSKKCNIHLNI